MDGNPIQLLTSRGKQRQGVVRNDKFRDAVPLINDIISHAWSESLDLYIACGGVSDGKDKLFRSLLGRSFSDLLEIAIRHGSNVCLLLWTKDPGELSSPSIERLRKEVAGASGQLEVRISGIDDDRFGHLMIATKPQAGRWLLRVEKAHRKAEYHQDFDVPAAVFFDNELAREYGEVALRQFAFFFGESDLIPREYWPREVGPKDGTWSSGSGPDRSPHFASGRT
jgi:hypothetical protein